ncbi:MAG: 5'/3'-nucleotidase SurE [Proteobacteria bacterium]|nr:5'/3'-nucleotidase SurE [Pseudomonadota bacterium]
MILITNDDGIQSDGIKVLYEEIKKKHRCVVVAPDRERSAVSRALTLYRPLRVERINGDFYSVDGTPTDCVNLAVNGLFKGKIKMVVSGINKGPNMAEDITYSGTVSAAMEGLLLGIPSIAVSCASKSDFLFESSARVASSIVDIVLRRGLPQDTLLNINVPNKPFNELKGIKITRMGKKKYSDTIIEKLDPRGKKYYWLAGEEIGYEPLENTDLEAVYNGYVSITPIHLDLTNYSVIDILNKDFGKFKLS